MMKIDQKIMIWAVAASAVSWVMDAAVDSFVFKKGSFFSDLFFDVSAHEIYFRVFVAVFFLLFGFVISRVVAKGNQTEEEFKKHAAAIETSMDGIAIYNRDSEYVYVNNAYALINGYENPKEIIGKAIDIAYDEEELERMKQAIVPVLEKSGKWRGEVVARRKNGSTYYQEASVTALEDGGRVCIIRDITWRKRNEERMHRSERFLNTIFYSIRDPFCIFDDDFRIIRVNEAYAQLKNTSVSELIGKRCYEALEGRDKVCEGCVVGKTFQSADPCAKEKVVTLHDGTRTHVEIYTYPILDPEGTVSHVIEYTRDVTARKKSEEEKRKLIERLEYLSRTDGLTGLINRRALTDSLTYEIDRAKRYSSELSLILCDIDNFKDINDKYGHDAGDRALQTMSATLKTILRKTDIAGRYGGDEFMIILPVTSLSGAENLADKLLSEMRNTDLRFEDGKQLRLSMSIGVACINGKNETIDSLIKRADDAMYVSKHGGRDRFSSTKPDF
jgi:diguanylate cyclase (GGDEF)-like protein/PAS domain S-box-containing protein